jgi:hypothetical protein
MKMIGHECPCIAGGVSICQNFIQAFQKKEPVFCVNKNFAFCNSPANDMMECPGGVYTCFAWHAYGVAYQQDDIKLISKERPLF